MQRNHFVMMGAAALVLLGGAGYLAMNTPSASYSYGEVNKGQPTLQTHDVVIGEAVVHAEVAETEEQREHGLSNRASLAPDSGMLFVFGEPDTYGFWMKDMRFALDFIYIREGKIVEIKEDMLPPLLSAIPFFPDKEFDAVLEVNSGWVAAHKVRVGDSVQY